MPFDLELDIDFVNGKVVVDGVRIAGFGVEQAGFQIECVGQAVGRIDAHHQRAIAELRKLEPGSGRQTRFPYAALAAEEQNAHDSILSVRLCRDGASSFRGVVRDVLSHSGGRRSLSGIELETGKEAKP